MVAAALLWWSETSAKENCICMLDASTQAFYSSNKVNNLCTDMPESRAKQMKSLRLSGTNSSCLPETCAAVTRKKKVDSTDTPATDAWLVKICTSFFY